MQSSGLIIGLCIFAALVRASGLTARFVSYRLRSVGLFSTLGVLYIDLLVLGVPGCVLDQRVTTI